jgi:hypothetical protein
MAWNAEGFKGASTGINFKLYHYRKGRKVDFVRNKAYISDRKKAM